MISMDGEMPRFRLMRACRLYLTPEQEEPFKRNFLIEVEDINSVPPFVARHLDEEPEDPEPPPEEEGNLLDDLIDIITDIPP